MRLRAIGLLAFGIFTYDPMYIAYKNLLCEVPDIKNIYGSGSYAIITGATDGIGKGFCEALAEKGMNIILISRTQEKLDRVAKEISEKYGIKCVTHAMDLSKASDHDYIELKKKTDVLDVSMLINNVGKVSYSRTKELKYNEIEEIINLNSVSMMHLLRMYLPTFERRRVRSAVINLSSFLAVRPMPIVSLYSGTKAFNHYLTEGLSEEYGDCIDILSFQPATVITNSTLNEKPSWRSCTVQQSVRGALLDLGRRRTTHGHWNHELLAWAIGWVPERIRLKYMIHSIDQTIKIRLQK